MCVNLIRSFCCTYYLSSIQALFIIVVLRSSCFVTFSVILLVPNTQYQYYLTFSLTVKAAPHKCVIRTSQPLSHR